MKTATGIKKNNRNGIPSGKKFLLPISVVCLILVLSISAVAAYIGRGSKKGVLVATAFYFESNVLQRTGTESEIEDKLNARPYIQGTASGSALCTVNIRNNRNSTQFNGIDITYTLRVWLGDTDGDDTGYSYSYRLNGEGGDTYTTITAADYSDASAVVGSNLTLAGGAPNGDLLEISWVWNGDPDAYNLETAKPVYVIAEPSSPTYMTQNVLGARINIGEAQLITHNFTCTYGFVTPEIPAESAPVNDYPGFTYRITTSGLNTNDDYITLSWDPQKLQLSPLYQTRYDIALATTYTGGVIYEGVTEENATWTITLEGNTTYTLVFYRGEAWDAENDENTASLNNMLTATRTTPVP